MALFRRKRAGTTREAGSEDVRHLEEFARSRRGVEGFVEPRTTVTSTTIALVAHDGEWTRRRIEDERAGLLGAIRTQRIDLGRRRRGIGRRRDDRIRGIRRDRIGGLVGLLVRAARE